MVANIGFIATKLNEVRANRQYLTMLMRDLEVYIGFYLIVMYFLGVG